MDVILTLILILALAFIITMICLFIQYGSIPDTLFTCFFAAVFGECSVMGWIKTTKERKQERKYEIEDRDYERGKHE